MASSTIDSARCFAECSSKCTRPTLNRETDMNFTWHRSVIYCSALLVFSGCATIPNGPSVAVMPAPGKPFDLFVAEDKECRQFAQQSIGGATAQQAANNSAVESAAVGTALGAVAGAAMGGSGQNGAGTGAAIGLLGGAMMGSQAAQYSGREAQRRYDIAYQQCMYAKGNQLPQSAAYRPRVIYSQPPAPPPATAPSYNSPPPPPPPSGQ